MLGKGHVQLATRPRHSSWGGSRFVPPLPSLLLLLAQALISHLLLCGHLLPSVCLHLTTLPFIPYTAANAVFLKKKISSKCPCFSTLNGFLLSQEHTASCLSRNRHLVNNCSIR